jgi:Uncharacterized membrane protein (homolog of Drosophila rhomboid)
MIFLRYESFRSYLKSYPVTTGIIALNLIYFIVVAVNGDPNNGLHAYKYGAFYTEPGADPYGMREPWRYITSMFMHAGIEHLLFNMFALLVFAPPLERLLKPLRYVPLYLASGIGGHLLAALMTIAAGEDSHLAVGASGAIYGVYGAYLYIALVRKNALDAASRKTIYLILGFGIVYSLFVPSVDLWGHAGGALTGFVLFRLLERAAMWKRRFDS